MMKKNAQTGAAILASSQTRISNRIVLPPAVPEKLTLNAGMVAVC
jgi:hypothetical protein